jgi:Sporulation and spore germination.
MIAFIRTVIIYVVEFLAVKTKRRISMLALIAIIALTEFLMLGLARRTFVFYTIENGEIVVEDRMLKRSRSREIDIMRYTEEALLGPVDPDLLPLFPYGTRLKSLLYRDGVVYADFSADAALPPAEGGIIYDNFRTFYDGVLRNFSMVKDVRFFIDGRTAFAGEFQRDVY